MHLMQQLRVVRSFTGIAVRFDEACLEDSSNGGQVWYSWRGINRYFDPTVSSGSLGLRIGNDRRHIGNSQR